MDKETTTSVTIDRKTFARLDRLAKSNNVSKKEFLSCALEYFEKYGINPVEHESPAKEMQKLIKRCDQVIAFGFSQFIPNRSGIVAYSSLFHITTCLKISTKNIYLSLRTHCLSSRLRYCCYK